MNNRNKKLISLMKEGFEFQTLKDMSDPHINMLYRKFIQESNYEEDIKGLEELTKAAQEAKNSLSDLSGEQSESELKEKSVSRQQQKLMGLALSVKRGDTPKSEVSKEVLDMVKSMSEKDLEDFASTKHKGLPKKKKETKEEDIKQIEESILHLLEKKNGKTLTKKDVLDEIDTIDDKPVNSNKLPEFLKFKNLNIKFRNE
jgi:hypothetical protein